MADFRRSLFAPLLRKEAHFHIECCRGSRERGCSRQPVKVPRNEWLARRLWTASSPEFSERLSDFALGAFFCGSPFIQDGATYALKHNTQRVQKMVEQYKRRRDYTMDRIQAIKGLSAEKPSGGMFVMVNVHEDGDRFARQLL